MSKLNVVQKDELHKLTAIECAEKLVDLMSKLEATEYLKSDFEYSKNGVEYEVTLNVKITN